MKAAWWRYERGAGETPLRDKGRVIIADDHGLFRQGLRQLLETEGYTVEAEATSGEEALKASPSTRAACCCSTSRCRA